MPKDTNATNIDNQLNHTVYNQYLIRAAEENASNNRILPIFLTLSSSPLLFGITALILWGLAIGVEKSQAKIKLKKEENHFLKTQSIAVVLAQVYLHKSLILNRNNNADSGFSLLQKILQKIGKTNPSKHIDSATIYDLDLPILEKIFDYVVGMTQENIKDTSNEKIKHTLKVWKQKHPHTIVETQSDSTVFSKLLLHQALVVVEKNVNQYDFTRDIEQGSHYGAKTSYHEHTL